MLLSRLYNKEVLKPKIVDYFIDSNFSSIEIFISVNAQRFSYQYNKQISDHILFINLFVNLLTKRKEIQQQIPMIWLYCDYRLNFENFERLKESMMLINERFYEKKEGLEYFSFSTLDNLKETGNFPPIKKEVLQREY
jgi:hypothetical protein